MQAEILPPTPFSTPEQQALIAKLNNPFPQAVLDWRVTATSDRDGARKGLVVPFADQRAYTDRLSECVTAAGWTRSYSVSTLSPLTRMSSGKLIQTGKVIVTATVTVHALGSHTGIGEEWADDENAMTRAEAQAFKRACTCFGLGRYFYDFAGVWVPLDNKGRIQHGKEPHLPSWALPAKTATPEPETGKGESPDPEFTIPPLPKPADPDLTPLIEKQFEEVGRLLYQEVFGAYHNKFPQTQAATNALELTSLHSQRWILKAFDHVNRDLREMRVLAESVGEESFGDLLDYYKVKTMSEISIATLKKVLPELKQMALRAAA